MFPRSSFAVFVLTLFAAYIPLFSRSDEISGCGQQIFEKNHGAVVTVEENSVSIITPAEQVLTVAKQVPSAASKADKEHKREVTQEPK